MRPAQSSSPYPGRAPARLRRTGIVVTAGLALAACVSASPSAPGGAQEPPFANAYPSEGDRGVRAPPTYFLRRAWVQLTRDIDRTPLPATIELDLASLRQRSFAVAWLGHSTLLVRAGNLWILTDPVLSTHVTPLPPFGPKRLTPLPIDPDRLPRIDLVVISHDHYDHLDLPTLQRLVRQPGGPPRILVGRGLQAWFQANLGLVPESFDWWQSTRGGGLAATFVPAQHNSGRTPWQRNRTLWGGWCLEHDGRRLYFAGDTAYSAAMFTDIRTRIGPIDLAALPVGAYRPRRWMRFEHTDPAEALEAHRRLGATRSIGIHWATFQLGDEEPFQPALDLAALDAERAGFVLLPVGGWVDVASPAADLTEHAIRHATTAR